MHKQTKQWSVFIFTPEQTNCPQRTTQFHTVLLCLYVADPATFLALNSILGTLFPSENSLFIQLWRKINIPQYLLLSYQLSMNFWISLEKPHIPLLNGCEDFFFQAV